MMPLMPKYKGRQRRGQKLEAVKVDRLTQHDALKKLFNLSLDMLCVADFEGCFQMINPAFENTLGYSRQELLNTPFTEYVHPDDRMATLATIEQLVDGKPVNYFENRYRCKDGSYKWLAWTLAQVTDERFIYAVARDITGHKRGEEGTRRQQRETASAMVNELNQPLAAIVSYCGAAVLLLNSLSSPPRQLGETLERAMEQAHRAGDIIRHLDKYDGKSD